MVIVFEKVIILGQGETAISCARFLLERHITPEIFCVGDHSKSYAKKVKGLLGEDAAQKLFQDSNRLVISDKNIEITLISLTEV